MCVGFQLSFLLYFHEEMTLTQVIVFLSLGIMIFYLFNLYEDWKRKSLKNLIMSIFLATIFFAFLVWVISFILPGGLEIYVIVTGACFLFTLISLSRTAIWLIQKYKLGQKAVLIVCKSNEDGSRIAEKFHAHPKGWFNVVEVCTTQNKGIINKNLRVVDVVIVSPEVDRSTQGLITNMCMKFGKEVLLVPKLYELVIIEGQMQQVNDMLTVSISSPASSQKGYQYCKRVVDIVFSLFLLGLTSPIFFSLYILIPLTSKGPAFFKQERIGLNGRPFQIMKFRSMVSNAEQITGPVLAAENDPRITPFGARLRSLRIDELPQLINVLKGEMSLVGPRPERMYFINQFKKEVPEYMQRLDVKPGITGLAQVSSNYSSEAEEKLRYDLFYVRNASILLDIKLLLQTMRVVLLREQAKGVVVGKEKVNKHKLSGIRIAKHN